MKPFTMLKLGLFLASLTAGAMTLSEFTESSASPHSESDGVLGKVANIAQKGAQRLKDIAGALPD